MSNKIAVYTITKNEEKFIERWAESAKEADYRVIIDTGSTDKTVQKAKKAGCIVHQISVVPWRFDDARNASLALLPSDADYCIALDADEILCEGWRKAVDALDPAIYNRARYQYIWNFNPDGTPGVTFISDKIHARNGYRWKYPVHERITPSSGVVENFCDIDMRIEHHADNSKSRGQYLNLLELAAKEDPADDRIAHYYARELYFYKMYFDAADEFKRHLALPTAQWKAERARSMRYLSECLPAERLEWLLKAVAEDPDRRENWYALAKYWHSVHAWEDCFAAVQHALKIEDKKLDYMTEPEAWSWAIYDTAAIACYYVNLKDAAKFYGQKALDLNPNDERLKANMQWYES